MVMTGSGNFAETSQIEPKNNREQSGLPSLRSKRRYVLEHTVFAFRVIFAGQRKVNAALLGPLM